MAAPMELAAAHAWELVLAAAPVKLASGAAPAALGCGKLVPQCAVTISRNESCMAISVEEYPRPPTPQR